MRHMHMLLARRARGAFGPGIVLAEFLRIPEALGERVAAGFVLDHAILDMLQPDALDPRRGALEIARFLAIELDEGGGDMDRLFLARDFGQQIGRADMDAAIAAD